MPVQDIEIQKGRSQQSSSKNSGMFISKTRAEVWIDDKQPYTLIPISGVTEKFNQEIPGCH